MGWSCNSSASKCLKYLTSAVFVGSHSNCLSRCSESKRSGIVSDLLPVIRGSYKSLFLSGIRMINPPIGTGHWHCWGQQAGQKITLYIYQDGQGDIQRDCWSRIEWMNKWNEKYFRYTLTISRSVENWCQGFSDYGTVLLLINWCPLLAYASLQPRSSEVKWSRGNNNRTCIVEEWFLQCCNLDHGNPYGLSSVSCAGGGCGRVQEIAQE